MKFQYHQLDNSQRIIMAEKYMQDPQWLKRVKSLFNLLDYNKNGTLEPADWQLWVNNIEKACKPDPPQLIDRLRELTGVYFEAIGIKEGRQLTCDEFVKGFSEFAVQEHAKKERGEIPILYPMNDAVYDVADTNKDGFVTLDEYRRIFQACNLPESAADEAFKVADTNHDGKLDREELNNYEFKFWFETGPIGKEAAGFFGQAFETN